MVTTEMRFVQKSGPDVIKLFFILNSAERDIYPAHNVKMPTIVDILTFITTFILLINIKCQQLLAF